MDPHGVPLSLRGWTVGLFLLFGDCEQCYGFCTQHRTPDLKAEHGAEHGGPSGSPASSLRVTIPVSCMLGAVPGAELPVGTGGHELAPGTVGWSPFWGSWAFVVLCYGGPGRL